ncbi:DUF4333 domain-containing protein [Nocardia sp. CNY236]|uniref:DUF4333 domain-containing protein n=1 Tax=Nocardia sp. CNY236 TaxID=1169152 RepID=UPI001E32B276|nr:DUF4333 domain-containing protein [Nocardia sp. CNY236]
MPTQQPPAQPGKGKGLIIGLSIASLLVIGGVVALVLVLNSRAVLDHVAVQEGVTEVLSQSYGIQDVSGVSCPSDQKVEIDATFECDLKVGGEAKKVSIKITEEDEPTYEVGRPR